jgi:hypothetical protein
MKTIEVKKTPVYVMDGLQCSMGPYDRLLCRSAFRWPAELVTANVSLLNQVSSYSPFPADMNLNPIKGYSVTGSPTSVSEVTFTFKEPLAHFRRDFEATGVDLDDFVVVK